MPSNTLGGEVTHIAVVSDELTTQLLQTTQEPTTMAITGVSGSTFDRNNTMAGRHLHVCTKTPSPYQTRVTLTEFRHGQRVFALFLSMLKTWTRPRASAGTMTSHILRGQVPFWSWRRGAGSPLGPYHMGGTLLKGRLSYYGQARRACGRLRRSGVCGATASSPHEALRTAVQETLGRTRHFRHGDARDDRVRQVGVLLIFWLLQSPAEVQVLDLG